MAYSQDETATEATSTDKTTSVVNVQSLPYLYAVYLYVNFTSNLTSRSRDFSVLSVVIFFLQQILGDLPAQFVLSTTPLSSCADKGENFNVFASKDTVEHTS